MSGLEPGLTDLTVTLAGYNHSFPDDVDVAMVSADGRAMVLMSDAGGAFDVAGPADLVLSDEATAQASRRLTHEG